jgi:hypothetical protein
MGHARERRKSDMKGRSGADTRHRQFAGLGAGSAQQIGERTIGGCAVHDEDRRRLHQEADRLEAGDRVVACLSHLRIDEIGIGGHQQGGAVGRGA